MIAEGSLSIGTPTSGIRVTSRSAPLPSSSSSTPDRIALQGNPEGEGRALATEQTGKGNRLSVSQSGDAQSAGTLVSARGEQPLNDEAAALTTPSASDGGLDSTLVKEATPKETREQELERLERLSEEINQKINERLTVRFSTDEETGVDLFQLIEQETGDVVRQIPSEELLEFLKKFQDTSGLLFSEQA